ncbi:LysR family transcriptional regulator [Aestuariibacter halophilus]|uniref:LysR family transcriptional regulator n=1 Tax=Fluctibacter halophilus TaxID=226011 RepID=A0ABS8G4P4_9ALTE|nr:LysR family transcriptional regulator [Aestuariibacter halophilus]MCC2615458.1 LysR family transcriptional regulator [Aestuariibacter halophilus]
MSVTYRQMLAFVRVANASTFAEAAEQLHLSQPALSTSIKKLEAYLGGSLFSRTTRKVTLSPEGEEFLPMATRLLNDWDATMADMRNVFAMRRGKLTLAAMPSYASAHLPDLLARFYQKWPNINVQILDVVMESVYQQVRTGRAELGFTFEHEQLDGLDFLPLMVDEFIAVVPASSPLADRSSVGLTDLLSHAFVMMERGSTVRRWLDAFFDAQHLSVATTIEAGQLSTLGQLVGVGLGVSIVPGLCRSQFNGLEVSCLPIEPVPITKRIGLIRAQRRALSVPAQALWDQIAEQQPD